MTTTENQSDNANLWMGADGQARLVFTIGSGYSASNPDPEEYEYTPKVKPAAQAGPAAGGCG
jgi:hypothetical protein